MKQPISWTRHAGVVTCFAVFALFLLWPMALTLSGAVLQTDADGTRAFSLRAFAEVFGDPLLREGLVNSLWVALGTTVLSLAFGLPLAVIVSAYEFRGKAILAAFLLVPLIVPPFVGVIGLRHLLGQYGAVNALLADWGWIAASQPIDFFRGEARMIGVIVVEALHFYPIVYLNASAALGNLDPTLEQAAENLGASRWQRFRRVTVPLILPGLFAGGAITFIGSLTELGTPLMFDYYHVTPVQIFYEVQEVEGSARPFALVAVLLVVALAIYGAARWMLGGEAHAMTGRAVTTAGLRRLRGTGAVCASVPLVVVVLLALLPPVCVLLASLAESGSWYRTVVPPAWTTDHFTQALTHPLAAGSIRNSLVYAAGAVTLDLVFGFAIAWLVVRAKVRGSAMLDALAMLPLAVPGLVLAFGYVAMSVQIKGWYARAGMEPPAILQVLGETPNPILFLMIAYAVRRLPYIVRSASAGLQQANPELESAAHNLGAGGFYTVRRVVLPLIFVNLIAGSLLVFSFAMLEVSDSLILAQREEDYPIVKGIFALNERLGDGPHIASAMGVWGMALLGVTLVGASLLLGRRLGAVFRA